MVLKFEKNLGGIKEMKKIPDAIFIVDPKKERICVQEAHTLGITLIGIADTNCDPEELDYVIPGNNLSLCVLLSCFCFLSLALFSLDDSVCHLGNDKLNGSDRDKRRYGCRC